MVAILGALAIAVGVGMWSLPLGLIVGGVESIAGAFFGANVQAKVAGR